MKLVRNKDAHAAYTAKPSMLHLGVVETSINSQ